MASVCPICRQSLLVFGLSKGVCPPCGVERRDIRVPCAGTCKMEFRLGYMEKLTVTLTPGKKGGKKLSLLYCPDCMAAVRKRMRDINDRQQSLISSKEKELSDRIRKKIGGKGEAPLSKDY